MSRGNSKKSVYHLLLEYLEKTSDPHITVFKHVYLFVVCLLLIWRPKMRSTLVLVSVSVELECWLDEQVGLPISSVHFTWVYAGGAGRTEVLEIVCQTSTYQQEVPKRGVMGWKVDPPNAFCLFLEPSDQNPGCESRSLWPSFATVHFIGLQFFARCLKVLGEQNNLPKIYFRKETWIKRRTQTLELCFLSDMTYQHFVCFVL